LLKQQAKANQFQIIKIIFIFYFHLFSFTAIYNQPKIKNIKKQISKLYFMTLSYYNLPATKVIHVISNTL